MPLVAVASALPIERNGHAVEPFPVLSLPMGSTERVPAAGAGHAQAELLHTCCVGAVCALLHTLAGFAPGLVPLQSLAAQQVPPAVH